MGHALWRWALIAVSWVLLLASFAAQGLAMVTDEVAAARHAAVALLLALAAIAFQVRAVAPSARGGSALHLAWPLVLFASSFLVWLLSIKVLAADFPEDYFPWLGSEGFVVFALVVLAISLCLLFWSWSAWTRATRGDSRPWWQPWSDGLRRLHPRAALGFAALLVAGLVFVVWTEPSPAAAWLAAWPLAVAAGIPSYFAGLRATS